MREYVIKGVSHRVYEDESELPSNFTYVEDWKKAEIGDWIKADDDCYIQILRKNRMKPHRKSSKHAREYVGTCTGTFMVNPSAKIDTEKRHNIYSFGGKKTSSKQLYDRERINSREQLFALYVAKGIDAVEAYLKAYETNNRKYAESKVKLLLKTERIKTAVKEEIKPILAELGIDEKFILNGIKNVAITAKQDGEKLKAYIKLCDIMEIEDKGTKQTGMAMVGFQGFKPESIDAVEKIMEIE
tara:strand:- start:103 stop:831 length:729 start_codon:yes stop_codon:yes gene_type:complete